ncbi:hypothetical protein JXJ21_18835 [candidate division KSB1 bacterium]|nr:hypothetical protein [candidate division KSB1 bacterium]
MLKLKSALFLGLIPVLILASGLRGEDINCQDCHIQLKIDNQSALRKPATSEERGIGVMDKGQLTNYIGNYGIISHYLEYLNDALHWPLAANDQTQYCFGLGLVVASKGNVVTSVLGAFADKVDWTPKDGSRGKIFSGDVTAPPPDMTPFLAISDNPETWPPGYFDNSGNWIDTPDERHWPGHFRIDIDPNSSIYGEEVFGEFVSDRDIYAVFDDKYNWHPDGPLGIEVEQTAYSYGRHYAEDMLFFDYIIHNTSGKHLDSVYVGYYAIFRPDYDFKDYINIIDSDPGDEYTNGDFVYVWDVNNTKEGAWEDDPTDMGIIGLCVIETPHDLGVTDFHFFNRDVAPKIDEEMWAVISSNPDDPNLTLPKAFFHGDDRRFDTTHPDSLKNYFPDGAPINFYIMTGPLNLEPGESVHSAIATVIGSAGSIPFEPDTSDLMANLRMAKKMSDRHFQGSGPPKTPVVKASAGDRQVRLVWDSAAESSRDALSGKNDFEGYKIYRSTDLGKTWGTPITDQTGAVIGYKPIKIFDKIDGIKGLDPVFNQSLGNETGIQHSYIDENLVNGVEYWYCVTAYDRGNQHPDSLEPSYQSPLGRSTMEAHTVAAIPAAKPQNYFPPDVGTNDGSLSPVGDDICQGIVRVDIVEPDKITGDDYVITFTDSARQVVGTDTNYVMGFNLFRISSATGDTIVLLHRHQFSDESGDNLPIVDGFRLTLQNSPSGIEFIGWVRVKGDTCTFDWRTGPTEALANDPMVVDEYIYTVYDFIIEIDTTETGGTQAHWYDFYTGTDMDTTLHLPIKVYAVVAAGDTVDVSENTWLYEFNLSAPEEARSRFFSPKGWDLEPGGSGFVKGSPGWYEKFADILVLEKIDIDPASGDTTYSGLFLQTNNFPDEYVNAKGETINQTAVKPRHGERFAIRTYKPFRKEITYEFNTRAARYAQNTQVDLAKIRVVPDPYIVSNSWETSQFDKKLMFTHLPNECDISIYTVAGDHIQTIHHQNQQGFEFWDMRTYNDQFIAFGLYVYVVSLPDGQKKIGRFLVIK